MNAIPPERQRRSRAPTPVDPGRAAPVRMRTADPVLDAVAQVQGGREALAQVAHQLRTSLRSLNHLRQALKRSLGWLAGALLAAVAVRYLRRLSPSPLALAAVLPLLLRPALARRGLSRPAARPPPPP